MATKYFDNLPNMYYANTLCKDITRRAIVTMANAAAPFTFYPYDIQSHLRSDHIAEYYYDQPELDWLVHAANEIVDPYFGWYQDDQTFEYAIIQKYGSVVEAQERIKHYINNWASDDTIISPSDYSSSIEQVLRKYWTPVYGAKLKLLGYKRKESDITQNTNQIWHYEISANNGASGFAINERVSIRATGTDTSIGSGEVETSNNTIVRIRNVSGVVEANTSTSLDLIGVTSGANISSVFSNNYYTNIPAGEFVYYSPVSFYDWEQEENEKRRTLVLVGDNISSQITEEFERLMKLDTDPDTGLSNG